MKGIIFNIFEKFITEKFDEDTYDEIVEKSNLLTLDPFVAPGTYPDKDLFSLIETTTKKLKISNKEALNSFGEFMFLQVIKKYPTFVDNITQLKEFLKTVETVIHVEVRKLYPDAETPSFQYKEPDTQTLIIENSSKRKLCYLMEGLIKGAAFYFKEKITCTQNQCMHRGDHICVFLIKFDGDL